MSGAEPAVLSHEGLYRAHRSWLTDWLRRRLGPCSDRAADFMHDTFVRLLQAGDRPPMLAQPRAYLTTIARGLVVDHFRRQDLERAYLQELAALPPDLHPSPEERAVLMETLLTLDRLLTGLGPKVREAFLLAQLEGWDHAQIAQHLGVSVSSVKKYMHKAVVQCLMQL
ncbi:sigma-70 family RNA polymerase sigma factor [Roseateles sp. SL47]|jgi:RNA polymerase sigma-19 factor, ECF subfamily|uniref:sigma-70 family RNA polymerase sigma factor n=1 Tax=Roseateles sp. SL47 TaxID=2995138 RepID=UPI0022715AA0|nr:sigma-70 family RNA polymerase sigma factor [Roseateles sp. SL47]WAC72004.1 sigma-70 family RNA polymerase sigma factor [Roseateles sp. SL47]